MKDSTVFSAFMIVALLCCSTTYAEKPANLSFEQYPLPTLDIMPNKCPNTLNANGNNPLKVAICGTEMFDVNEIDIATVEILGVHPIRSKYHDVSTAILLQEEPFPCNTEGPDGYLDLVLKFDKQEILTAIGKVEEGDINFLSLDAVLQDETAISLTDWFTIVKKGKSDNPDEPIDIMPPTPNPAQWQMEPYQVSQSTSTIAMEAVQAIDPEDNGIEYCFVCVEDDSLSSGWIQQQMYEVSGLNGGQTYTFYVITQDCSPAQNETEPSAPVSIMIANIDIEPPLPNPAQHGSGSPMEIYIPTYNTYFHVISAVEATDPSGVEYKFVCSNSYFSSGNGGDPDGIEWRNIDNVVGLIYPDGTPQTPQMYWARTGITHPDLTWYIITRDRSVNHNTGDPSLARSITTPQP